MMRKVHRYIKPTELENDWVLTVVYKTYTMLYISYKVAILFVSQIVKNVIKSAINLRKKAKSIYFKMAKKNELLPS